MAVSYSDLKVVTIADGTEVGTWGQITNANLAIALEEAIVGEANVNFTSDAALTITLADQAIPESQTARNFVLDVTSSVSLTGTRDLIVPAIQKPYIVKNNTSGSQSIRVIAGGTGVTIPNGQSAFIYNNGSNIETAFDFFPSLTVGDELICAGSGQLRLPAGTTAERPGSPVNGGIRYNSENGNVEAYVSSAWEAIATTTTAASFPSGTKMVFAQAAAPTGWTRDTSESANNRMLRVISTGSGGGTGGTHSPILNNLVPAHTHGFTTGDQSQSHTHTGTTGGESATHNHTYTGNGTQVASAGKSGQVVGNATKTTSDNSAGHVHTFTTDNANQGHTHSGTTDNGSSSTNWEPKYLDMIVCTKD